MKQSLFKILCLVYCLFIGTSVLAINVTIDNISYSLNISNRTASVTGSSLQNVVVPETINYDDIIYDVTAITASAFSSNTTIETFKSSSIKRIEDSQIGWDNSWNGDWREPIGTFARATNLSEVSLENVEFIGAGAFYQATSLTKVYVGNKLESIGSLAFGGCYNLKYIVIPSSISSIYTYSRWRASSSYASFYGCSNLIIICLSEGYDTGSASQTMYPSSFFNFGNNTFDYNGKVPEINYKFNGIGRGFQPTEIDKGEIDVNAGTHTVNLKCTFTNDDMSFYVEIPYEYTINPVTLKAIVNDASRLYGETDPQFSSTYSGFVNNEDASVVTSDGSYTTTAKVKSDVGTYAIRQTGATAQNYVFEYEDGTLTVNKAPLTMTANDKTMAYGDKVPTLDAKYEGLKNDETQPAWSSEPVFSTTATSISNVGTYPITISNAEAKNYQLTVNNGTMTIEKANLTVSADNKSRKYGEVNPEFTLLYTGLKNDEPLPEWEKLPIIETSADINSSVGKYPISVKNGVAKNYDVTVIEGTLTIEKAELQVMTNDVTRKYGEENPSFDLGYAGFVNNEDENVLVSKPKAMTEATAKSNVGTYDIVIDGGVAENYDFKYIAGKLTIEKAFQTLTWDQEFNDVIQYDLIELTASASSGLEVTYIVEGRQICSITKIGDMQYLDCTGEGETVIIAIQEGNDNYWQSSKIYKQISIEMKPDNVDIIRNGILYKTLSYNTVEVVGASRSTTNLNIPESISFKGSTYHVKSIGEAAFHKNSTIESVVLPNSITSIGEIAFGACSNLKSINIPNSVTRIGAAAFYGCESLTSINIPDGMKEIGGCMFWGCVNLTDVIIPNSVTIIDEEAFRECLTLGAIRIPCNVKEVGKNAFQKCFKLMDVYCYAENVPITDDTVFDGTPIESATLHVPASVIEAYKASWPWGNFKEIVAIGDANGDGEIDDDDVNAISDYITTGNSDYLNLKNADINGDKVVNVADIVTLLNIIMASQTKPDGGGDNPTPVNPSDNDLETDKIIASFTGGAYSMINGKIQSGSKLNIKFSNNSSKSVTLTKIQLNDAETGAEGNNLLSEEFVVAAGQNVSYTITVGALGIYKPVISFTYRYNNKTYQVKDEWKEMNIEIPNIGF